MEYKHIAKTLRNQGYRITRARQEIITWILQTPKPFTSKDLTQAMEAINLQCNPSTIFRELNFLVDNHILNRLTLEPGTVHYESAALDHHHHLHCLKCGHIQDITCTLLPHTLPKIKQTAQTQGFQITDHQLEFHGYCRDCQ